MLGLSGPSDPVAPAHRISMRVVGPVALVEEEREVLIGAKQTVASDTVVDLDLPEGAALLDWSTRVGNRTIKLAAAASAKAHTDYVAVLSSHRLAGAKVPSDEDTRFRVHLAPLVGKTSVLLRYRYTAPMACSDGRFVLRLPANLEENPSAAQVTVRFDMPKGLKLKTASVAGISVAIQPNGRAPVIHASAQAAWEVIFALREPAAAWPGQVTAARAAGKSRALDLLAVGVCRPLRPPTNQPPGETMLLIDRSRSVGSGGMSSQRALARALLEALPPAQRFNAILFGRTVTQVFALSRTATREALDGFAAAADPNQLENGTDLVAALARAGDWLKGEEGTSHLLVIISDGALPDSQTEAKLVGVLSPFASAKLRLLILLVRPAADDGVSPEAVARFNKLAGRFGGVVRVLPAEDLRTVARSSLSALAQGGDLFNVRLAGHQKLAAGLAPGSGVMKTLSVPSGQRIRVEGEYGGAEVRASTSAAGITAEWLQPLGDRSPTTAWAGSSSEIAVLIESIMPHSKPTGEAMARGQMDPVVLRNALALAYLPRARACYLSRRVANGVDLNLQGRVRLELHLDRGELEEAVVRQSSLNRPEIERCVREAAYAIDYPRPMFRDAPTVAALNLVFRPRTPEEIRPDASPFDREIDLILGPVTFDPQKLLEGDGLVRQSDSAENQSGR